MNFTFDELVIIDYILQNSSKIKFLEKIDELICNSEDKEIKKCLFYLYNKIASLSEIQFHQLFKDKIERKVTTQPPYELII